MELELDDRQRAMLREMGVHVWLPPSEARETVVAERAVQAVGVGQGPRDTEQKTQASQPMVEKAPAEVSTLADKLPTATMALQGLHWPALAQAAATCQACGLCTGRKNSTLQAPETPVQCDWLVLGDPPDEDEDRLGQPFSEQAGVLLDNMLKSVGARRGGAAKAGAYVTNVVKCRPSNARIPQLAEMQVCAQFLQREIALVQPKLILAMGRFATQLLLQEHPQQAALPLGKQRGTVYRYQGVPVVVTYHPAYLLRNLSAKAGAWSDLCMAAALMRQG